MPMRHNGGEWGQIFLLVTRQIITILQGMMSASEANSLFQKQKEALLATSNLRTILKDKAKSIRDQRFKVSKQPEISYMPLKTHNTNPQSTSFSSMMTRLTKTIKQDMLDKCASKRNSQRKIPLFATTFTVQRLQTNNTLTPQKKLYSRAQQLLSNQKSSSYQQFQKLLKNQRNPRKSDENTNNDKNNEERMLASAYLPARKKKNKITNQYSRIHRGSSFSRSKHSFKMLTEETQNKQAESTHFAKDYKEFQPLGNIEQSSKRRVVSEYNIYESNIIELNECQEEPLKQVYDHIFIKKHSLRSKQGRRFTSNYKAEKCNSNSNNLRSSDGYLARREVQTQQRKRIKVYSQEKLQIPAPVPSSSSRKNQDFGPWA